MSQARGQSPFPVDAQRRHRFGWLRILFSFGLLAAVCVVVDWQEEFALLRHVAWGWVVVGIVLHVINRFISVTKWQILLRAKGLAHPYGDLLGIIWVSNFFGHFLPSAVGGDSLRMWQVARRSERAPEAVSTVFVERLTGVISLAGLALLGGIWSWARWGEHLVFVALLAPIAALLIILGLLWTSLGERMLEWMLSRFHRLPGYAFLKKTAEASHSFRRHSGAILQALAISGIIQFNRVASVYCLARALGITLLFGEAMVVVPAALFIAMLPLSVGGLGLHEGAFVVFLGLAGLSKSAAFGIALLSRLATMASNLPGGVLFLLEGFGRKATAGAAHVPDRNGKPLRVLWLADKLGYGGYLHGLGQYYATIAPSLKEVEVIPVVFRMDPGLAGLFASRGLRIRHLRRGRFDLRVVWTLARMMQREQVDVVQLHGFEASVVGRIAAWMVRKPIVIRQGDMVTAPWLIRMWDRLCSRLTSRAIAISGPVKQFLMEERAIPADRITVIPHAIRPLCLAEPDELDTLRRNLRLPPGAKIIGSVTRFHPIKGVRYLIEALPRVLENVPAAYLLLWGDGPERPMLEARVRELGIADRVRLMGFQPDASRFLGMVDCFVLPSLSEGFSFALLEAMAASQPIVATRVGGVPEIVNDTEQALLVPPADAGALAGAIIEILRDQTLAERLGRAARIASEHYTMTAHTASLQRLYREVGS